VAFWEVMPFPEMMLAHTEDAGMLNTITQGTNMLEISEPMRYNPDSQSWMYDALLVYSVTIFIEYEY